MSFAPGDEVVCVDDGDMDRRGLCAAPVRGRHYTVREVRMTGLWLVEIVNPRQQSICNATGRREFVEPNFLLDRFRPVRRDCIEAFKRFCVEVTEKTPSKVHHDSQGHLRAQIGTPPAASCALTFIPSLLRQPHDRRRERAAGVTVPTVVAALTHSARM